jgi:glycosyltransferase involved in cell wall biosynthesis
MPLVSVLMPSYNHDKYLRESIESILDQTLKDLELVIVDDASSDTSREIILEYAQGDKRIKGIFHERNMGIAKTVNHAIDASTGKFIAFTASDDVWMPKKLEMQVEILTKNENLVVWSDGEIIDETGKISAKLFVDLHGARKRKKSGKILDELLAGNYVFGTSRILKRANMNGIRFEESLRYLDDYRFEIDLAKRYEYYYINEPLAKYRIHPRNTIFSKKREIVEERLNLCKELMREFNGDMSNRTRSRNLSTIGKDYINLHELKLGRSHLLKAIKYDPFHLVDYLILLKSIGPEDGHLAKMLERVQNSMRPVVQRLNKQERQ